MVENGIASNEELDGPLTNQPKPVLDPMDRVSEVLFALIMVLTFTCSFSIAGAGREEVARTLDRGAGLQSCLGLDRCRVLFDGLIQHGRARNSQAKGADSGCHPIRGTSNHSRCPTPCVARALSSEELEQMHKKLKRVAICQYARA